MLDKKFIGGGFYYENCETYEAWLEDSSIGSVEIVYNDYGYPAYYKVKALKVGKTRIHIKCSNSSSDWEGSYGVFVTGPSISYYDSNKIELTVGQSCTRWFIPSDYASLYYHFEQWNKTSSDIVDVVFLDANNKEVDLNNIQNYAKVKNIKVTAKKAGTTELTAEARAEDGNHYGAYTDPAWKIVVKEPLTYQVTADNVKNNNWTNSETTKFTITFNQDVDGFTLDDISLSSELKNPIFKKVNNKQYELTVTNPELAMGIGIYIKPNSCTVSGTSKLFNSSKMYYYCVDRIKPTVNITKVETDNTDNTYANKDSTITIEFNISDNGYFYGSAGDLVKKQNFKAFVVDAGESNYIQEGVEFEKIGTSESKRSYRVRIKNIEKYEGKLNFQILNNDTSLSDLAGNTFETYAYLQDKENYKEIIIDNTLPTIESEEFNPEVSTNWVNKQVVKITASDNITPAENLKCTYAWYNNSKNENEENGSVKVNEEIVKNTGSGVYTLIVTIEDFAGNTLIKTYVPFYIDAKVSATEMGKVKVTKNSAEGEEYTFTKVGEGNKTYYEGAYVKDNLYIHKEDGGKEEGAESGHSKTTYEIYKIEETEEGTYEETLITVGTGTTVDTTLCHNYNYKIKVTTKDVAGNTRKEEYILHKGTGNIKFNPDGNQGAVGKAKTMATLTDEKNEYKSIKYAWKEEGKEPEESEYKENYKVEQYKKGQEIESEELYDGKYNLYIRTEDSKGNINVVKSKTFEIRGKIQTPGEIEFRENTEDGEKIEAKENEIKTKENVWIKIINQGKDPYGEVETTFEIRKEENVVAVGNNTIEIVTLTNQGEYELTLISKRVNKTNPELEVENKTTYKIIVDKEGPKVVFERKSQDNQKEGQIQVTITDEGTAQTGVKEETLRYYWTNGNYKPGKEDFEGESQEGYKGKIEGTKAVIKTPKNESGIWVLWVYAEDQVGNVTIKQERTIGDNDTVIDNQAPVAGKLEITTLEENGEEKEYKTEKTQDEQKEEGENTNKDIKIKLLPGYDSISGVKSNTYKVEKENGEKIKIEGKTEFEGEITLTEHGIYKATVTTIDKAQGQNTSTRQYIIKIDKEGPKVTYENTENGENGSKESIEKVKVRPTVVDEAGVENSALKYSWVKFESVEKYNEFQKAEKTIEKLKEKMGEGKTFSNGEEISSPENIEGIYSLFVYAKDKLGNESVSYSEYYAFKLGKDEKHEYVLAGEYITKVKPETKVEDFIEKVKTVVAGSTYEVYDKKGNEIEEGNIVTTASTIKVDGKTYTIIVVGDLNGDGKLTGTDLVQMRFSRVGKYELKGAYEKAADINSDGKVTGTDLVQMRLIKVGLADYTE